MADHRFSKNQRLLTAADFQRVFDHSCIKASSRNLLLLAANNDLPQSRIGFIIAKKQIRTAVKRNRIKRIIREFFRQHCEELPGFDIIVLVRKGFDQMSNDEINDTFAHHWQKLVTKADSRQV